MLRHDAIHEAYLIVEHASGDTASAADIRVSPLGQILGDIWRDYCFHTDSEDPFIRKVDYSR
jgi:hypothetical protein